MEREKLGSRIGFILLSAGCAIGIGNVWKFPYLAGQNGGGAFVLLYLLFLVLLGLPVMTMEFAMGRAAGTSPVRMYQKLTPEKKGWHWHGIVCLIGNIILMMFYTTVAGWMLLYFVKTAFGTFSGRDADGVATVFSAMQADPVQMVIAMGVTVAAGFFICSLGLQKGLEWATKRIMPALIVIMIILAVNSIFLKGGARGLSFYLIPDFGRMASVGMGKVIAAAMNQAFFTLSLGIGSMAIFGSYIDKSRALPGEAVNVAVLDTIVAIVSGMIIFPACFAYEVEPGSGPGLIFITLPNIFNHMPLGRLWGSLFFVFMSFAAFSTVLAVFENIMAMCMDLFGWSRKKSGFVNAIVMFLLSVPCALGFNVWSFIQPLGEGSSILDLEDLIVSNYILPIGAFIFVLFCTTRYGWGWDNFVKEADEGRGLKVRSWMRPYVTYVLPVIVLLVFILGVI